MAAFKCKMCGSELHILESQSVAECEYCGSKQTLPKLDGNDRKANLIDRANHFFREGEFDQAMERFEQILNEGSHDCDVYWSLVLCRYGVRYVEDPKTKKRIPTVNRVQYDSVLNDDNYKSALKYADEEQRAVYEADAKTINEIQKGILAISQNEEPFDVFICYKETDDKETDPKRKRTRDSVLAHELYFQLTQENFKVFFAPITLEDKLGQEYEPYIFAALQSAKVMVVLGTKPEYFTAPWVKNEWSRFLALVKASNGKKKLIPAYRNMDPYDMPVEFSNLQAQDMDKLGFMQDLIHGIQKIIGEGSLKVEKQETVISASVAPEIVPKLKRVFLLLEDGEFSHADDLCEEILNKDPENAQAYLAKLMIELKVKKKTGLALLNDPFTNSHKYAKILRFGDHALIKELETCNKSIIERAEERRIRSIYTESIRRLQTATEASVIEEIRTNLIPIRKYKDTEAYIRLCEDKLDFLAKAPIYVTACTVLNDSTVWQGGRKDLSSYKEAIEMLRSLNGWRDSEEKIRQCQQHIDEIVHKEEYERMKVVYEDAKHIMYNIGTPIALKKAAEKFESIKAYKDAAALAQECLRKIEYAQKNPTYSRACEIFDDSKLWEGQPKDIKAYENAISLFKSLNGFMDSEQKIAQCREEIARIKMQEETDRRLAEQAKADREHRKEARREAASKAAKKSMKAAVIVIPVVLIAVFVTVLITFIIPHKKYDNAVGLMNEGRYEEAIAAFEKMDGYKDTADLIESCRVAILDREYTTACDLFAQGKYEEARAVFETLSGHKDSKDKINACHTAISDREYAKAMNLLQQGKYHEAIAAFEALKGYKDSKNKISECYAALDAAYNAAIARIDQGDYDGAIAALEALKGYKDSKKKIEFAKYVKDIGINDLWIFGAYEQDGNEENRAEKIEWVVLDKQGTKLLVVSKYALDYMAFHNNKTDATWESSYVRTWLNDTFYHTAFTPEQQAVIMQASVSANANPNWPDVYPGHDTVDRLFLLGYNELQQYFGENVGMQCSATPFAVSKGAKEACRWWLRTLTYSHVMVTCVESDGTIKKYGDEITALNAVRPAMWVNLSQLPQFQ